jgi:hypothetical protein
VFSGLQYGDGVFGMKRDRSNEVNRVYIGVG